MHETDSGVLGTFAQLFVVLRCVVICALVYNTVLVYFAKLF